MKKIFFFLLIFLYQTFSSAKTTENVEFNRKYLSNYFSAIISSNNQDDKESLKYFIQSKFLLNSHENFFENYIFSLVFNDKIDEAIKKIKFSESQKKDFFEAQLLLVIDTIKKKDFNKSIIHIKKLNDLSGSNQLRLIISEILLQYVKVFKDKKIDLNKKKNIGQIDLINTIFKLSYLNDERASNFYLKLLENEDLDYSRYLFFYTSYLIEINDLKKLREIKAKLNPINSSLLLSQLRIWLENGEYKEIKNLFSHKREDHLISEFLFLIANLYSSQEKYSDSNFYLVLSNYLNPNFVINKTLLIENQLDRKKFSSAKETLNELSDKNLIYKWYKIRKKYLIIEEEESADSAFRFIKDKYKSISKKNPKIEFEMAGIYKKYKDYQPAIQIYNTLLKQTNLDDYTKADILYRRGGSYERLKMYLKADDDLLLSLEKKGDEPYVLNYLAYSWLERSQNIDRAIKMLNQAYDLKTDDPYITDSLGWGYYLLGDYLNAEKYLKRAVELMPYDPIVNDHYGDILWMLDRKIQARYFWKNVIKMENTEEEMIEKINLKIIQGLKSS